MTPEELKKDLKVAIREVLEEEGLTKKKKKRPKDTRTFYQKCCHVSFGILGLGSLFIYQLYYIYKDGHWLNKILCTFFAIIYFGGILSEPNPTGLRGPIGG